MTSGGFKKINQIKYEGESIEGKVNDLSYIQKSDEDVKICKGKDNNTDEQNFNQNPSY